MATQPLYQPYTPSTGTTPRPNVHVAFSNGIAAAAMERAVAALPPTIWNATLDELAIVEQARAVIAQAKSLLSTPMYLAFLEWGEASSLLSTLNETGNVGDAEFDGFTTALDRVNAVTAVETHDVLFKAYLLSLEATESSCFGPIVQPDDDEHLLEKLARSTHDDIATASPIAAGLRNLATEAWRLSNSSVGFSPIVGKLITDTFTRATIDTFETVVANMPPWLKVVPAVVGLNIPLVEAADTSMAAAGENPMLDEPSESDVTRIAAAGVPVRDSAAPSASSRFPADVAPPLSFDPAAPLWDLVDQRNAVVAWMNSDRPFTEQEDSDHCDALNGIENIVTERSAANPADAIAKLVVIVQISAEGAEVSDADAGRALIDARRHLGLGYVCDAMRAQVGEELPVLSDIEVRWNEAWEELQAALAGDEVVSARHARAKADGTVTVAIEKEWDDSGTRLSIAEWALFETPAPALAAVLWKMKMIQSRGLVFDDNIAAKMVADVERLGGANVVVGETVVNPSEQGK